MHMKKIVLLLLLTLFLAVSCNQNSQSIPNEPPAAETNEQARTKEPQSKMLDFKSLSPIFTFSATLPGHWQAEFVPSIESINIFNPEAPGANNLEKSQIFIRYFVANSFLTLHSVDILKREPATIGSHDAVRYEIKKKESFANFTSQPSWRNQQHKLIDIRLEKKNPSTFFVFAYNPSLPDSTFNSFVQSIFFDIDNQPQVHAPPPAETSQTASMVWPISRPTERVTKKPFGLKVSPANSPVSPERFSGYHNAVDFEILSGEETADVPVFAICTGKLLQKRTVNGYGGLAVQSCAINGQAVTVNYGHVRLSSISTQAGGILEAGAQFAVLGSPGPETGNERKHLHLGIHKGTNLDIRGYVQKQSDLGEWIDIREILK